MPFTAMPPAPALVDTVPFGAFRRDLLEKVGPYDESLLTNEDYEFNTRIRQTGGRIWLDPAIHSVYYARSNLAALARQYGRYGFWKYPDAAALSPHLALAAGPAAFICAQPDLPGGAGVILAAGRLAAAAGVGLLYLVILVLGAISARPGARRIFA